MADTNETPTTVETVTVKQHNNTVLIIVVAFIVVIIILFLSLFHPTKLPHLNTDEERQKDSIIAADKAKVEILQHQVEIYQHLNDSLLKDNAGIDNTVNRKKNNVSQNETKKKAIKDRINSPSFNDDSIRNAFSKFGQ